MATETATQNTTWDISKNYELLWDTNQETKPIVLQTSGKYVDRNIQIIMNNR